MSFAIDQSTFAINQLHRLQLINNRKCSVDQFSYCRIWSTLTVAHLGFAIDQPTFAIDQLTFTIDQLTYTIDLEQTIYFSVHHRFL